MRNKNVVPIRLADGQTVWMPAEKTEPIVSARNILAGIIFGGGFLASAMLVYLHMPSF